MTRHLPALPLVFLIGVAGCVGALRPPAAAPTRALVPATEDVRPGAPKPFAVVFGGPRGATIDPTEITVVFNRPMRPLELVGDESAPPATLRAVGATTSPPGRWLWMGTSTLVFAPEGRLPRATEYQVTVAADARALDGSRLPAPYSFSFSTARPRLVRVSPPRGSERIAPTQEFELRFNQAVDPKEVERAAKLHVGRLEGPALAVNVTRPKDDVKGLVTLTPAAPLPADSGILLTLDPSMRGLEGPLTLGESKPTGWTTYGPLRVLEARCTHPDDDATCYAHSGVTLVLSNPVKVRDVMRYASVDALAPATWGLRQRDLTSDDGDDESSAWDGWAPSDDDQTLTEIQLPGELPADSRHVVTVRAGLVDELGQKLAHDATFTLSTQPEPEIVDIGLRGQTLEAVRGPPGRLAPTRVPIYSVNQPSFDVLVAPFDERETTELLQLRDLDEGKDHSDRFLASVFALDGARVRTVRPGARRNVQDTTSVTLADLLGSKATTGASVLGLREGSPMDAKLLSVTDLAVTAKVSRFGDVFWVTRLSTGAPVGSATVTVRDERGRDLATTTTNADGIATLADDPGRPTEQRWHGDHRALFVRAGDDWTFHAMWEGFGRATAGERWQVRDDGDLHPSGRIFTERGVYRPGETARVKGFFRKPLARGTSTPVGDRVSVKASIDSREVFAGAATLDAYGAFAVDVTIPRDATRSGLSVEASLDGDERSATEAYAHVADFEPVEFSVDVKVDGARAYVRGETAAFEVHGDYLFGAPMAGAKVRWTARRSDSAFQPPNSRGLVCSDEAYLWPLRSARSSRDDDRVGTGVGLLDAHGVYAGSAGLTMPKVETSQDVTIEAEVEDASRKTTASRASVVVHPGDFYVALQPPDEPFVARGATLHPRVAAVEPSGKRRAGIPVHVEVIRRSWTSGAPADRPLGGCDTTTVDGATLAGCDVVLAEYGDYVIRATARDAKHNEIASSFEAYALGGPASSEKVEVKPDKRQYEIGDVAKLAITSPWPDSDALVTIERTGVYHQERVQLHGSTGLVRVPITEDLWPNAFAVVHVVRGRTHDAPLHGGFDAGRPAFRVGWAPLAIDRDAHTLAVAVTPDRRSHRPGDELDVDVDVKTREGKPSGASVTLWAVDEGALMLTGYRTPDVAETFSRERPLAVFGLDSRTDLAQILSHASLSFGIGGVGGYGNGSGRLEGSTRGDFRPTAFFEPALVVGPDGHLRHRFKLPDGLTTYRIMAVAATTADRFGSGEASVVTSQPLMARASLPRFLRAGDAIEAGVLLTSKGLPSTTADVTLEANGVTVAGGPAQHGIALAPGGTVEVTWPIQATSGGQATFTFSAAAGHDSDRLRVTREISVPTTLEAVALSGATTTAAAEQLGDLGAIRTDVGGLDLRVASTALVGLGGGVEQLLDYPYGCTEQLASRLVPLVPLRRLAHDFDLPLPADVDRVIDATVSKIVLNQQRDGSFGYWPSSTVGDTWVTAYALWALTTARDDGHAVPADVIAKAVAALQAYVAKDEKQSGVQLATQAFVVDVLAQAGAADKARMRALFESRESLPLFARALLAHAMVTTRFDANATRELLRDVENHLRVTATGATVAEVLGDEYAPLLDSEARTTAMVTRALLAADKGSPLAARLARGLLDARRGGTWRTTQETAWALLALNDYRMAQEARAPDFDALVFHGNELLARAPFHGLTTREVAVSIPAARLVSAASAPFTFSVQGTGSLFYEARLRYAKKTLPVEAVDRGFAVRKVVRPVSAEGLREAVRSLALTSATSATAGQLVLVDLFVTTTDPREQVVVDDPVPAGLQPVQTGFATTADWLDISADGDRADEEASGDDDRASGRGVNEAWYRREVRDDRVLTFVDHMPAGFYHYRYLARAVTVGRFVVPPTQVECMYEPETFGRTAGSRFEVKPLAAR